jgi:hypothetical protein
MIARARAVVVVLITVFAGAGTSSAQITLAVGHGIGDQGSEIEIPILVRDAQELGPVQFELLYDPSVIEGLDVVAGSMFNGMVDSLVIEPGQMNVVMITSGAMSGDGELVRARFRIEGGAGSSSILTLKNVLAFEAIRLTDVLVDTEDGSLTVSGTPFPLLALLALVVLLLLAGIVWRLLRRRARSPAVPRGGSRSDAQAPAQNESQSGSQDGSQDGSQGAARFCRHCGARLESTDHFCAGCGQALSD